MSEEKLIYAATPFRMENQIEDICNFIEQKGHFPVHPLLALPIQRYNYDRHSRENIYKVCFGLVDLCNEVWIFGIGGGSLKEYLRAKQHEKPTQSFVKIFDPVYAAYSQRKKYQQKKYKTIVEEILLKSHTKY